MNYEIFQPSLIAIQPFLYIYLLVKVSAYEDARTGIRKIAEQTLKTFESSANNDIETRMCGERKYWTTGVS